MTISSTSFLNTQLYQPLSQSKKDSLASYDDILSSSTNYQQVETESLKKPTTSIVNNSQASEASTGATVQYSYAPNISAIFNAYLEKQRLNSSLDGRVEQTAQRLKDNGTDKKLAEQYAQSSVELYKQILESQLNYKINQQVEQQKEFKQRMDSSSTANPYVQMTGSLVNLYS